MSISLFLQIRNLISPFSGNCWKGSFERPSAKSTTASHFWIYRGLMVADSVAITPQNVPNDFEARITKDPATDTLHYWYKPYMERDTLKVCR